MKIWLQTNTFQRTELDYGRTGIHSTNTNARSLSHIWYIFDCISPNADHLWVKREKFCPLTYWNQWNLGSVASISVILKESYYLLYCLLFLSLRRLKPNLAVIKMQMEFIFWQHLRLRYHCYDVIWKLFVHVKVEWCFITAISDINSSITKWYRYMSFRRRCWCIKVKNKMKVEVE